MNGFHTGTCRVLISKPVSSHISDPDLRGDFQKIAVLPDGKITAPHTEACWWNAAQTNLEH